MSKIYEFLLLIVYNAKKCSFYFIWKKLKYNFEKKYRLLYR